MLELFPGSTHYLNMIFPIIVYSSEIFIERYLSGKKFLPTIISRLNLRPLHFIWFSHVLVISLKMIFSCPDRRLLVSAFVHLMFLVLLRREVSR